MPLNVLAVFIWSAFQWLPLWDFHRLTWKAKWNCIIPSRWSVVPLIRFIWFHIIKTDAVELVCVCERQRPRLEKIQKRKKQIQSYEVCTFTTCYRKVSNIGWVIYLSQLQRVPGLYLNRFILEDMIICSYLNLLNISSMFTHCIEKKLVYCLFLQKKFLFEQKYRSHTLIITFYFSVFFHCC